MRAAGRQPTRWPGGDLAVGAEQDDLAAGVVDAQHQHLGLEAGDPPRRSTTHTTVLPTSLGAPHRVTSRIAAVLPTSLGARTG